MKNLLTSILLTLVSLTIYAQDNTESNNSPKYKIGLTYGDSFYEKGEEGNTLGLEFVSQVHKTWNISGFLEKNFQEEKSANQHIQIGFLVGQRFKLFDKFELSYGVGLGFINRQIDEKYSTATGENIFGLTTYNHYSRVEKYVGMTVPLRFNLDYKFSKHFSAGIVTRTAYHKKPTFGSVNISVGYHF